MHKSPSRLRRDQYEDIMVQQDQISLMNEAYCEKLDKIGKLETELQILTNFYDDRRKSLIFARVVNIDIPPALPSSKIESMKKHPWPDN